MHKLLNFPQLLPKSILELIPSNAPTPGSNHENSTAWLEKYELSCPHYRRTLFNKGPLLWMNQKNQDVIKPACLLSIKTYKNSVKSLMLSSQNIGSEEEWPNFILNSINGLRKSSRLN